MGMLLILPKLDLDSSVLPLFYFVSLIFLDCFDFVIKGRKGLTNHSLYDSLQLNLWTGWCKIIFVHKVSPLINKSFYFRLLIISVNESIILETSHTVPLG